MAGPTGLIDTEMSQLCLHITNPREIRAELAPQSSQAMLPCNDTLMVKEGNLGV